MNGWFLWDYTKGKVPATDYNNVGFLQNPVHLSGYRSPGKNLNLRESRTRLTSFWKTVSTPPPTAISDTLVATH